MVALLTACASPTERFTREAESLGFTATVLQGAPFRHVAFFGDLEMPGPALHAYIEHDGTPWLEEATVAADPTPRRPFALELMARDTGPRLLLGRPCYFETRTDPRCSPLEWTYRRYSADVVISMASALRAFLSSRRFESVVLIGYSGGGTLAWLMAAQVPETVAVITVAANLDTDAWTSLHRYSQMAGSLNPALQPPLPEAIRQIHFVGERDANVPPSVAMAFAARHPNARIIAFPQFDHICCWIENWPKLLRSAKIENP